MYYCNYVRVFAVVIIISHHLGLSVQLIGITSIRNHTPKSNIIYCSTIKLNNIFHKMIKKKKNFIFFIPINCFIDLSLLLLFLFSINVFMNMYLY